MAPDTTPETLRDRDAVAYDEETRTLPDEKYAALRERYDAIDGVVQVGVCDDDRVLLVGPDEWVPPGGNVRPDEDWAAAAERNLETLTGVPVAVEDAVLVERTYFTPEGGDDRFPADVVTFRATLAADAPDFRAAPSVAPDLDHPLYGDGADVELAWFDHVPADVHENHAHHVRPFVD